MKQYKKNQGITLIELMITISIIAILATLAVSSYSKYILQSEATDLVVAHKAFELKLNLCIKFDKGCSATNEEIQSQPNFSTSAAVKRDLQTTLISDNGLCILTSIIDSSGDISSKSAKASLSSKATDEICIAAAGI